MNEYDKDYSKINSEDFTQRDLMQYLLHSTQHIVTREEVQEVKAELKTDIQKIGSELKEVRSELKEVGSELKANIKEVRSELEEVRSEIKTNIKEVRSEIKEVRSEIKEVRSEIKEVRSELKIDINKLDNKFDRMQWFLVAGFLGVLFKDYIIKIFS